MKKYCVKAWDGVMEWNSEYYEFEAENDDAATKIAQEWFDTEYLPETLGDPSSYSNYPDEDDFEDEDDYWQAVCEANDELGAELHWEFVSIEK